VPRSSSLRQLRLKLLSLLDQKVGREKYILRRSISALDRLIREKEDREKEKTKEDEKDSKPRYPYVGNQ
jgi:hypothetical protein